MYNITLHGSLLSLDIDSRLLRDNPLGDPNQRQFPVYLPPDYDESHQRFPTIYALAGFTGTGQNMPNFNVWEESLPEQIDDLIVNGDCPPVIVVMPDCFTGLGGSQYVNSTATGAYEDYIVTEIIPLVDRKLRTLAAGNHRGVIGKSSGGYGALRLAMRHPGLFGSVACQSGDMYFEYSYLRDFPVAVNGLNQAGGLAAFLEQFARSRKKGALIPTLNIIAMAAAYSPRDSKPELPFDLPSGELIPEVWERWLAFDPIRMVDTPEAAAALRDLNLLFIDAGERDEYALHLGARIFVSKLYNLGITHEYEEFPDGHFGINYRMKTGLEKVARSLFDTHDPAVMQS
ncbi:alpha/beta hydrolase [Candidatus Neomarinimicrobiota bacterium]